MAQRAELPRLQRLFRQGRGNPAQAAASIQGNAETVGIVCTTVEKVTLLQRGVLNTFICLCRLPQGRVRAAVDAEQGEAGRHLQALRGRAGPKRQGRTIQSR